MLALCQATSDPALKTSTRIEVLAAQTSSDTFSYVETLGNKRSPPPIQLVVFMDCVHLFCRMICDDSLLIVCMICVDSLLNARMSCDDSLLIVCMDYGDSLLID